MKFGVQTIKIYNMINFTRGLNPLDAMGIGEKIIKIKDFGRVRLSSIEITEDSDELITLMSKTKKIC
mgnify:CR=1 FL=1